MGKEGDPEEKIEQSAHFFEWTFAGSFLLLLLSFILISQITRFKIQSEFFDLPIQEKIPIVLKGAFLKPNTYWVLPGTQVGAVLKKGRPKRFANLKGVDLERRVETPFELELEELQELTVYIEGAVLEAKELHLPLRSKVFELKEKILCTPQANQGVFKSRRYLKDGEVFLVPKREIPGEINSSQKRD